MCEVTLKIDESKLRKANPLLTDKESITRWAQHLMDACIADLAEEDYPLPEGLKPYTLEELHAMIDAAEAEIAAGIGTPHEEVMREMDEEIARWKAEEKALKKAKTYVEEELLEAV
jgi:hypothetical protein